MPHFNYKYCRNGHMLYSSSGHINKKHCGTCGEPFVSACENCGAKISESFHSVVYTTSGQPINFPTRPDHCANCGAPFPWQDNDSTSAVTDIWSLLHPLVVGISRKRFEDGYYADSVESAMKALNKAVKQIVKQRTGEELDGVSLMRKALSPNNPIIVLGDLGTESGKNIQQGYMDLFAGAISGIRNPKAHDNIVIDEVRALHHLFLASLLFIKLDERL